MKLGQTFYAAVTPSGQILTPSDGKSNGLHDKPGKAQAYLSKQTKQYEMYVASMTDSINRGTIYNDLSLRNYAYYKEYVNDLKLTEVKEVKVVLV